MLPSIALPFKQMDTQQQISFAKNLVNKMTTDQRFEALAPTVKELSTKINEWQIAILHAKTGGKIKTIKKIEKGLTVRDKVFFLANEIEKMAEHDQAVIVAAGYELARKKIDFKEKAFTSLEIEELLVTMA